MARRGALVRWGSALALAASVVVLVTATLAVSLDRSPDTPHEHN
jgi:hypothetical protein